MCHNLLSSLTITQISSDLFSKFGITYKGYYNSKELIKILKNNNFIIDEIFGIKFNNSLDFILYDIPENDFDINFYSNIVSDNDLERENYKKIISILDQNFIIDKILLNSEKSGDFGRVEFYGNLIDSDGLIVKNSFQILSIRLSF
jgi:hypothetical protein